jgi:hypothetical protein
MGERPSKQHAALQALLEPGERVLWTGQPTNLGLALEPLSVFLPPATEMRISIWVVWAAALSPAIFMYAWVGLTVFRSPDPLGLAVLAVSGLPFLLPALFVIGKRVARMRAAARGMTYAITDRRVLLESRNGRRRTLSSGTFVVNFVEELGGSETVFKELAIADITSVRATVARSGVGSIAFNRRMTIAPLSVASEFRLMSIPEAERVTRLLEEMRASQVAAASSQVVGSEA